VLELALQRQGWPDLASWASTLVVGVDKSCGAPPLPSFTPRSSGRGPDLMASNLIFRQFDEDAERTAAARGWARRACGSGRYACPWVFFFYLFLILFIVAGI